MNILEKIANELDTLSKSERKVAEVIIDNPEYLICHTNENWYRDGSFNFC